MEQSIFKTCWLMLLVACLLPTGCGKEVERNGLVEGSSMAPNFVGQHYWVDCPTCKAEFNCEIEQVDQRLSLVCPNCAALVEKSRAKRRPASAVQIQPGATGIERWDVVAFQMPVIADEQNPVAGIKRVVGLPGEAIEIRNGNLYADGKIIRKSIAQQKAIRVPVHDSFYWRRDEHLRPVVASDFPRVGESLLFTPVAGDEAIHWLGFQLSKNYSHPAEDNQHPVPVEDYYGFNQSLSRNLNPMDEVFVSIEATSADACLYWQYSYRGRIFVFQLDIDRQELSVKGSGLEFNPIAVDLGGSTDSTNRKIVVEFSSMDLELVVWINNQECFRRTMPESDDPVAVSLLDFGASRGPLTFRRIRIWRDLYYFTSQDSESSVFAAADGYILLGDNVPVSIDSRHWPDPRTSKARIIGTIKPR